MRKLLLTGFGTGYLPIAPGTWGSLAAALLWLAAVWLLARAGCTAWSMFAVVVAGIAAASIVCIGFGASAVRAWKRKDPPRVVIDEFAGQWVALLPVVFVPVGWNMLYAALAAFVLFRLFDVVKPSPARQAEALPNGVGILADDLLAGAYAAVSLLLIFALRIGWGGPPAPAGVAESIGHLTLLQAVALGVLQGLTEFLPVSSSGHLVLLQRVFGLQSESTALMFFDAAVHVATLLAVGVVFVRPLGKFLGRLLVELRWLWRVGGRGRRAVDGRRRPRLLAVRVASLALLASVITIVLALMFKDPLEAAFEKPLVVAIGWLITGALLILMDWLRSPKCGWSRFGPVDAAIIGFAQAVAIVPGVSRSGSTIATSRLMGLHPRWAVQFSFLIAALPILGATAKKALEVYGLVQGNLTYLPILPILAGMIVAFVVGLAALVLVVRLVERARLWYFAPYCCVLGVATLLAVAFGRL